MWRILALALFVTASRLVLAGYACLEYGEVSLVGTLVRQTYPGPPDYESVTKGDAPRTIWVLQLDEAACVTDPRELTVYGEREIQLLLDATQYERYRDMLGRRVRVGGTLSRGGARHELKLVLTVGRMARARAT